MSGLERASYGAIHHNAQCKIYPDGGARWLVSNRAIFRERGWEEERRDPAPEAEGPEAPESDPARAAENIERSKRRARAAVYDLARSSDFEYFVTLTTDQEKVDRFDDLAVFKKLHKWLDNNVQRRGLTYVLIPEYHKKGGLHFHAFFNAALEAVDSGTISLPGEKRPRRPRSAAERERWLASGGKVVYNLPGWELGFSTAIRLYGDRRAAVGYVCKYIGKSEKKIGGRWYYSGGDLRRPDVVTCDRDYEAAFAAAAEAAAEAAEAAEKRAAEAAQYAPQKKAARAAAAAKAARAFAAAGGTYGIDNLGARCCAFEEGLV